jgi:hypothetical protein
MKSREKDLGKIDKRRHIERSSDAASSRLPRPQMLEDAMATWNAFDAAHGAFADEHSTL